MADFRPYVPEEKYKVVLSKDEVLLIQKIRSIGFGSVTAHISANKIARTETSISELSKDKGKDAFTISFEVIGS
jgi:hypothetical protein